MTNLAIETRTDRVGRAILLTMISIGGFGLQDVVSKFLVQDYSPFQITMMRYWGFALFSLWLVSRQGPLRQAFASRAVGWQIARGVLLMLDLWFFALALQTVPLGELQAMIIVSPLMVTLFAIPLLGEKVGIFRFSAVAAGFVGALIVIRPGAVPLEWGVAHALLSSVFYAIYIVVTRKVSAVDSAATSMVYVAIVGLVMSGAVGVFFWQPMGWVDVLLTIFIMGTTCLGHGLMTYALSMAPASTLQPFSYFSLPWAIFLSATVFGHWIDPLALLGAAVIVAAGLVVMARERKKALVPQAEHNLPGHD